MDMKICQIKSISFKSNDIEDNILGYDDSISQNSRNAIRKWHESTYIPYQSIYEKECNLTDYQLSQLLASMMKKPKIVDYKSMMSIPIYNVKPVDTKGKSYRGSTLVNHSECLPVLKKAGIERVVDLVGYTKYEHDVKNAGLEYYCPKFGRSITGLWCETAFSSLSEYIREELKYCGPLNQENKTKYIQSLTNDYKKKSRESVDDFIELIQFLQKDYYYIGCQFGTDRTSAYLLLNEVFNPKAQVAYPNLKLSDYVACFELDYMLELYKKLTPEDKQALGWTDEFDHDVLKRLTE